MSIFNREKRVRQNERDFYNQKQAARNDPLQDNTRPVNNKRRKGPTPKWTYQVPALLGPIGIWLLLVMLIQILLSKINNINPINKLHPTSMFTNFGVSGLYGILFIFGVPILMGIFYYKFRQMWQSKNVLFDDDDQMTEFTNDAYIRTADNISQELIPVPDLGLGFKGHASTLMTHWFMGNKGIKKIDMPQYDKNVDGYVKTDDDGNIVTKHVPMFNPALADKLFSMPAVPQKFRTLYDATDYDFNKKLKKSEGGGKDEDGNYKRAGTYDRKPYDTVADYINNEFHPLDSDTERPSGVYWCDDRAVNTILIAITRGGKGQTYIEPAFDVWTREDDKWNIFTTDPKGELLTKFYYPATIRGYEIVQFNLMHPHLTNVYNPLANIAQAFRQNNPTQGTRLIDSIVDTLFPDNGEIWNSAAGNMFRRAVYILLDYYTEQETYIRHLGHKNHIPQDIIDDQVDKNYAKLTLFNVYSWIGELAAAKSKDVKFINVNPDVPPTTEKDLLTLIFDAIEMLPENTLRSKAIVANNAIKQIASAEQTIAGIYATLLTNLSIYSDDTTIALMSGSLNESFDVGGLGFPRRIGIQFDDDYVKKFRISKELGIWSVYKDPEFTDKYEGKKYQHMERISPSNWIWGHFAGTFENEITYMKLQIKTSDGTIAKEFFFKFVKGYKKYDGISYVIDPITKKKVVSGGTLIELNPETKEPEVSEFSNKEMDIENESYHDVIKPVLMSNQVFYSEKPKFIFAVTPPHLQVYQKHILLIIKQILDEVYNMSYSTKANRKPIVGTRLMLEEFGNIRSGDKGIPNIDTVTSIALGQNVQLTFVLQSFQQIRAIYKDDVEKIIRANASNTVFLKSNDEELINELVRLSGSKHEHQINSKSFERKKGDPIPIGNPGNNYSMENKETTALTSNDLMFLAGPTPGNAITFSSGEMAIVNKLDTVLPMAAGMHRHLPEPKTGKYSDATLPSTNTNDSVNFMDNMIDGTQMVTARVDQAKIWHDNIKPKVDKLIQKYDLHINERDGSMSNLVMNAVYEEYDKHAGNTHVEFSNAESYWEIAERLYENANIISDKQNSQEDRLTAVTHIKEDLAKCATDDALNDLTRIYINTQPTGKVNMGYDSTAISKFIIAFRHKYPKPKKPEVEKQDIYAKANEDPNYHQSDANEDKPFDLLTTDDTKAFELIVESIILNKRDPIPGLEIEEAPDSDEINVKYKIDVDGVYVMTDVHNTKTAIFTPDYDMKNANAINQAVANNQHVLAAVQTEIADS